MLFVTIAILFSERVSLIKLFWGSVLFGVLMFVFINFWFSVILGLNIYYLMQWTEDGIDISALTRGGHMVAAINAFWANPFFGLGPGLVGYKLSFYYPEFIWQSPEIDHWISQGGVVGFLCFRVGFDCLLNLVCSAFF